jgi:hypothetical protein
MSPFWSVVVGSVFGAPQNDTENLNSFELKGVHCTVWASAGRVAAKTTTSVMNRFS